MNLHELFPEISLNPASAKDIKQWVLKLAVEGKLTKKWREDNKINLVSVSEKISIVSDIDIQFDFEIPLEWSYVKLGSICNLPYGKGLNTSELMDEGFDVFGANGIIGKFKTYHFEDEKLLISCRGAYSGKPNISPKKCFVTSNSIICDFLFDELTYYKFYFYAIQAVPKEKIVTGSAQPQVTATNARNLILPLPGFEEQHAIVKIVEDLFKEVDELANKATQRIELKRSYAQAALKRLSETDTTAEWKQLVSVFPEIFNDKQTIKTLRETILQLAVQGKLTAKWRGKSPSLSPASELLEQIKAEKAQLIKEKKIKAEKPLPKIEADEIPFELPEGWVWCRLGEVCEIKGGKRVPAGYQLNRNVTPYIYLRVSDMKNGTIVDTDLHYIDQEVYQTIKNYTISKDDIYMTIVGATIGKCGLVPDRFDGCNLTENAVKIIPYKISKEFLYQLLTIPFVQLQFNDKTKKVGVEKLSIINFKATTLPLPPLSEQQIIVEKVNALMGLCDELEREVEGKENLNKMLNTILK